MSDFNLDRQLLDAIPSAVFLVDDRLRILHTNAAAAGWLKGDPTTALGRKYGDALQCIHAQGPRGCGHSTCCPGCALRGAANQAFATRQRVQCRFRLDVQSGNQIERRPARVTASPFSSRDSIQALLVLDDMAELIDLQRILPVCLGCKRPRSDPEYWARVETYVQRHPDLTFTHCLCPDCLKAEMVKLDELLAQHRQT